MEANEKVIEQGARPWHRWMVMILLAVALATVVSAVVGATGPSCCPWPPWPSSPGGSTWTS